MKSNLRNDIAFEVERHTGDYPLVDEKATADHILALVREALLSDAAVKAAQIAYFETESSTARIRDQIEEIVIAAVDAVLGEDATS